MFDTTSGTVTSTQEVAAMVAALGRLDRSVSDAERVEQLRVLEELKAAAAAAQARAVLPVAQGVAAYAALVRAADTARTAGDPRSRGQVMADTLVERLTGQATAAAVPVEVAVVITDRALLDPTSPDSPDGADGREPAMLPGHGPVPAGWARDLIRSSADADAPVAVRRLFTHPRTGELVALEARTRAFPEGLRRFLRLRDQTCRTPWCDAPVRHADHITPRQAGGATSAGNGQGLCEHCNYTKQASGWRSVVAVARPHEVVTTAPTGHAYRSRAPGQPGAPPPRTSRLELSFRDLVVEAA